MSALRLAARALWFRRGASLAVVVVATFVVAAATAGPVYLRAAGESVLQDTLRAAGPDAAGIESTLVGTPGQNPGARLDAAVRHALRGSPGHGAPISALELDVSLRGAGGVAVQSRLTARTAVCAAARVTGACPRAAGDALVSERAAKRLGVSVGTRLESSAGGPLRVVGLYLPYDEAASYWFGRDYFHEPGETDRQDTELVDAVFTTPATLLQLPDDVLLRAVVDVPADVKGLRLAAAGRLAAGARAALADIAQRAPESQSASSLPQLLDRAQSSARLLRVPVLIVVLQLLVLSWLVLFTVVANSVDSRRPEIGLAKLRGFRTPQTVGFGLAEPFVLLVVAFPLGLLVGVAAVRAVAERSLVKGVPVELGWPAAAAAALAVVGGALAATAAARSTITRPALEQFRRTGPSGTRRGWTTDAAVLVLASAGLLQLVVSGAVSGDRVDPVALLAPGLVSLAAALLAARALPAVCRALAAPTRARRRLGLFLAVRQVARRPAGARTVVVLVVAFGLASFSVSGWSVTRDNRHARALTVIGAEQVLSVTPPRGRDVADVVREVDPGAQWAMAVSDLELLSSSASGRRVLAVDTPRLPAVAFWRGDFAGPGIEALARALRPVAPPPVVIRGDGLALRLRTARIAVTGLPRSGARLVAELRDSSGLTRTVALGTIPDGTAELRARVDCPQGCRLSAIRVDRTAFGQISASLVLQEISAIRGGVATPLDAGLHDAARWRPLADDGAPTLTDDASGLVVDLATTESSRPGVSPADSPSPLPAVVTPSLVAKPGAPSPVVGLDQASIDIRTVAVARALPRGQADAALVDRTYALRQTGAGGSRAADEVWLGPSAPADAAQRLARAGLTIRAVERAADLEDELERQGPALALLLFLIGAVAAAVLAAGGTVLDLYLLGRRRIGEMSAMQMLGVRRRALRSALLIEQALLVGTGALAGVGAGVLGALLALPSVPEFEEVPAAPPLLFHPDTALLAQLVAVTTALLALAVTAAVAGLVRGVRPDRLREVPA